MTRLCKLRASCQAPKPRTLGGQDLELLPRTMDLSKDIRAIEESSLFRQWKAGAINQNNPLDLFDLLGAFAYTPARVLIDRIKTLEIIATELERQDILDFLSAVRKEFADKFRE